MIEGKTRGLRQSTKCGVCQAGDLSWPDPTTGHGGCHSQAVAAIFFPNSFSFLRSLSFSHAIFQFCDGILPLKEDVSSYI